jgi:hypothetical protein
MAVADIRADPDDQLFNKPLQDHRHGSKVLDRSSPMVNRVSR